MKKLIFWSTFITLIAIIVTIYSIYDAKRYSDVLTTAPPQQLEKVDNNVVPVKEKATQIPAESTAQPVEKPIDKSPAEVKNITKVEKQPNQNLAVNTETADVPVSPFGFGPYPEIPAEFWDFHGEEPDPNFWTYDLGKNHELMMRVALKLWEQGKPTYGETMSKGLVYPKYPNTIIVKWNTEETPFGTRRYSSLTSWSPGTESFQRELKRQGRPVYEDEVPSHITVIERKDAGIDPYEFLDLPK